MERSLQRRLLSLHWVMQQKIQLCGCLPAARLARTGKQQSGSRGACEQIPKLQPRQEAPFPCCRTLCAQPQLPGLAVELVQAEMHGLGILHPAGYKVSLADRWPSSDQLQIGDCLKRWEPPQGKQLATVQEVLHRSSRGRAGVCITICRVIYISFINYPTCNLLTTPGLNITTLVKEKKKLLWKLHWPYAVRITTWWFVIGKINFFWQCRRATIRFVPTRAEWVLACVVL